MFRHSTRASAATMLLKSCSAGLMASLLLAAPLIAQNNAPAPAAANARKTAADSHLDDKQPHLPYHELIGEFGFEEPYGESTPIDWLAVRNRHYPAYTRGRLISDIAHTEDMSFRIDLNGGNCSYEYDPRRLAILSDYDYCVEGYIRTEKLRFSGASISAWLNDSRGRPIDESRVRTPVVRGTRDWQLVRVYVSSSQMADEQAQSQAPRYLGLALDVKGDHAQDIGGHVWFDSIRIFRLPRVRMNVSGGSFHNLGQPIDAVVSAERLGDQHLSGWLLIRNSRGRLLSKRPVKLESAAPDQPALFRTSVDDLPPGVYEFVFDVDAERPTVMRRSRWLAVLAPLQSSAAVRGMGFGIENITGLDDPARTAAIVQAVGVRAVKVRLWNQSSTAEELRNGHPETIALLEALNKAGVECIGVLGDPPAVLTTAAADLRPGVADLLSQPLSHYEAALSFTVSRFCGPVRRWQIGEPGDDSVLQLHQQRNLLREALEQIDRLTAAQPVSLAWPALYELPSPVPERIDAVSLLLDEAITPPEIAHYLPRRRQDAEGVAAAPAVQLTLPGLPWSGQDADGRIIDFVQRIVAAKVAGVDEIFFDRLLGGGSGLMRSAERPDELLLVARTITDMLGTSRYVGDMQLESAGQALVFERADGSEVLVLWHDDPHGTVLQPLYLGQQLHATDVWGNRRPVPHNDRVSTLQLSRMPLFVTGIDSHLSRMRRSFQVRGGKLEASYQRHTVQVQFENPFNNPLAGHVRLRAPAGWKIDPQILDFHLATGERALFNVTVVAPYDETTGMKELTGDFHVPGDAPLRFRALAPLNLEMKTAYTAALGYVHDGKLIVEQEIVNKSDAPITLKAYMQVPGRPMVSHIILDLKPGATVTRKYEVSFDASLTGKQALVGIREEGVNRGFSNVLVPMGEPLRSHSGR